MNLKATKVTMIAGTIHQSAEADRHIKSYANQAVQSQPQEIKEIRNGVKHF